MARIAVIGGGISGLAAAWFLRQLLGKAAEIVVYEKDGRIGGHLRVSEVAGTPVDEGAESLLARRPEAVELARAVGLADDVRDPAPIAAGLWSRGRMWPMPAGTVMGVPEDPRQLAGLLTGMEIAASRDDAPGLPITEDVAIGRLVGERFGRAVVDRLVEPLLGGVYAGHADELSLDATVPALGAAARTHQSLGSAVAAVRSAGETTSPALPRLASLRPELSDVPRPVSSRPQLGNVPRRVSSRPQLGNVPRPVFAGIDGGVGRLPEAVEKAAAVTVRTGTTVRELIPTKTGWRLAAGPVPRPEYADVDAVVLAVPAAAAARLLSGPVPSAAAELAGVETASMAIVTLALPSAAFPALPASSGFLVPPADGHLVKAVTYSSMKWPWLAARSGDLVLLRASIGRHHQVEELQRDDAELVDAVLSDLHEAVGLAGRPVETRVTRWGGALPQYAVGHRDRVARVRAAVASVGGLAVCGALYDGVGVAACVASARMAAEHIAAGVASGLGWGHVRIES